MALADEEQPSDNDNGHNWEPIPKLDGVANVSCGCCCVLSSYGKILKTNDRPEFIVAIVCQFITFIAWQK